jgi:hypothetical protein
MLRSLNTSIGDQLVGTLAGQTDARARHLDLVEHRLGPRSTVYARTADADGTSLFWLGIGLRRYMHLVGEVVLDVFLAFVTEEGDDRL